MNRNPNNIIKKLKTALSGDLPGTEIQWEMASSDRMIRDFPRKKNIDSRLGAVLILLYPVEGKIYTVLIQRPVYDGVHSGQIGFPGGKKDGADRDLIETSIRETCEETGVCNDQVEVIATLTPLFIPVSNIEVTPVLAFSNERPAFHPSEDEVEHIIEVELTRFFDITIIKEKLMDVGDDHLIVKFYDYDGYVIWGATAMILHELLVLIKREDISLQV